MFTNLLALTTIWLKLQNLAEGFPKYFFFFLPCVTEILLREYSTANKLLKVCCFILSPTSSLYGSTCILFICQTLKKEMLLPLRNKLLRLKLQIFRTHGVCETNFMYQLNLLFISLFFLDQYYFKSFTVHVIQVIFPIKRN